jgi:hypothetical protein
MGDFMIFCSLVEFIIWLSLDNYEDNYKQLITTSSFPNLIISFF